MESGVTESFDQSFNNLHILQLYMENSPQHAAVLLLVCVYIQYAVS